jgi:hypothetical protein
VVRDAEFFFAAMENQRHDEILLIVEVSDHPFSSVALASA